MNKICVIGARPDGSSKVVLDIIRLSKRYNIIEFFDDNPKLHGTRVGEYLVIGSINLLKSEKYKGASFIIAFGNNELRSEIFQTLIDYGLIPVNMFHPTATIAEDVTLGKGIWLAANAVINPGCVIGDGVVINTAATVDHDCIISPFVNISPGCHLSGRTKIKDFSFLGTGAITIPDVEIGKNVIIGAGSVVISNVPDGSTAVGIPARLIKERN